MKMLVAAKCTQCGANIQVDSTHEAGICPNCGTAFITEKAVNNYNTSYITTNNYNTVTNINGGEVHIHGDSETPEQLFQKIKDSIENLDPFPYDIFNGVQGSLRANIDKFEQKFPLDPRNKEIDVLIFLRLLNDNCKSFKAHPEKHVEFHTELWIPLFNAFQKVNAAGAEHHRALFLEKLNDCLSAMYGSEIKGDMFDLKCSFFDFPYLVQQGLKCRKDYVNERDDARRREEENEKLPANARLAVFPARLIDYFDEKFVQDLTEKQELLSDKSQGYDGEFLLYLYSVAQQALCSQFLLVGYKYEKENTAKKTFSDFANRIRTVLSFDDKTRANNSVKQIFFASRRAHYKKSWSTYVSFLTQKNIAAAESVLRSLADYGNVRYAYSVRNSNFKKGLFGKIHYKQNVPDRDADALTERTLEEDYREFLKKN